FMFGAERFLGPEDFMKLARIFHGLHSLFQSGHFAMALIDRAVEAGSKAWPSIGEITHGRGSLRGLPAFLIDLVFKVQSRFLEFGFGRLIEVLESHGFGGLIAGLIHHVHEFLIYLL